MFACLCARCCVSTDCGRITWQSGTKTFLRWMSLSSPHYLQVFGTIYTFGFVWTLLISVKSLSWNVLDWISNSLILKRNPSVLMLLRPFSWHKISCEYLACVEIVCVVSVSQIADAQLWEFPLESDICNWILFLIIHIYQRMRHYISNIPKQTLNDGVG